MFLRNYDNILAWLLTQDYASSTNFGAINPSMSPPSSNNFEDGSLNIRVPNGALTSYLYGTGYYDASSKYTGLNSLLNFNEKGICLGDGSKAVTYDDYKLSGNLITNNLVRLSRTRVWDGENLKWTVTLKSTYSNTGSTDITISEWGIYRNNNSGSSVKYSNDGSSTILIYREVLDEPIVIEAGTTATLTFSIDIPMPNHP